MSILRDIVAGAVAEIRGAFSGNEEHTLTPVARAAEADEHRNFAPVTARGDAAGDTALALRSSNEEPRPGGRSLLPGTALPGPGTCSVESDPASGGSDAEVFIDTDAVQGILGDVDWDVLTGGDAAVRILGDDGQLHPPGERRR